MNVTDFRVVIFAEDEARLLDNDEVIADVINKRDQQSKGFFFMFGNKKKQKIVFGMRKIIYLSRDLEERDYK